MTSKRSKKKTKVVHNPLLDVDFELIACPNVDIVDFDDNDTVSASVNIYVPS